MFTVAIRVPRSEECKLLKVTADRSARNSPRQVPCHVSRAPTEFGHAAEACCGRCLTSERNDTNQSAPTSSRRCGRCRLNLNCENPIGLCRITFPFFKIAV